MVAAFTLLVNSNRGIRAWWASGHAAEAERANEMCSGAVVVSASAALFVYLKGHGSAMFRDGSRLVLITFFLSSFLWALIDLVAVLVTDSRSPSPCQAALITTTVFDQVARFSIEQYMIWTIHSGTELSVGQLLPQVLALGRFVLGAVFAGLTRAQSGQTDVFCAAQSSSIPVAVATIALDFVILLLLVVRAFWTGLAADTRHHKTELARSRSLGLVMAGFAVWTGVRSQA